MSVLGSKLIVIDAALTATGIPHAFGGAIALAYCTRHPRATSDLDINVFLDTEQVDEILASMPGQISITSRNRTILAENGQDRLWWGDTPVDVFLNTHNFHDDVSERIRWENFEGRQIPLLMCRDLAVFKAMFNRLKDWADLQEMFRAGALDAEALRRTIVDLLGADDERLTRLDEITVS